MPVGNKSPTWRPGWCSSARQVPPERCSLTQIHAGAIFGSPVLQQQHDPDRGVTPNPPEPRVFQNVRGSETKAPFDEQRLVVGVGCQRRSCANTPSTVPGWHDTHHFPSLFDQGEHAQDVGLLRSPAHPACGPGTLSSLPSSRPHLQPQTRPDIWAEMENPGKTRDTHTHHIRIIQPTGFTHVWLQLRTVAEGSRRKPVGTHTARQEHWAVGARLTAACPDLNQHTLWLLPSP